MTGYFQEDEHCQGDWPAIVANGENAGELVIRLGDVAFQDVLHAGTIVEISDEGELVQSPGTDVFVRDDTPLLQDIARLAFEWYGKQRYAYSVTYAQIVRDVLPGMIATSIDGQATDVVVTEVNWDFERRATAIATAYAEPDFSGIARERLLTR